MPRYTTSRKKKSNREKRRLRKTVPRDRRKLMRWAARGDSTDYEKLRRHARKLMVDYDIPAFVNFDDVEQLANTDKGKLIQAIHHDNVRTYAHPHLRGFLDALSFVLDKASLRGWDWPANLLKQGTKVFRGEKLTELDELYAKIVDDSYRKRPDRVEDYYRVPEVDSDYVTVWETSDGHRLVSVRGTVPSNPSDLLKDAEIAATGTVSADTIGATLQNILESTSPGTPIDVASHSLGTTLVLRAYNENPELQKRIHQTYLFNPAYNPSGIFSTDYKSIATKYEQDDRVRYFINLGDLVSVGGIGSKGPSNVVYKSPLSDNTGFINHTLEQWQGHYKASTAAEAPPPQPQPEQIGLDTMQYGTEKFGEPISQEDVVSAPIDYGQGLLDFGSDDFVASINRQLAD